MERKTTNQLYNSENNCYIGNCHSVNAVFEWNSLDFTWHIPFPFNINYSNWIRNKNVLMKKVNSNIKTNEQNSFIKIFIDGYFLEWLETDKVDKYSWEEPALSNLWKVNISKTTQCGGTGDVTIMWITISANRRNICLLVWMKLTIKSNVNWLEMGLTLK